MREGLATRQSNNGGFLNSNTYTVITIYISLSVFSVSVAISVILVLAAARLACLKMHASFNALNFTQFTAMHEDRSGNFFCTTAILAFPESYLANIFRYTVYCTCLFTFVLSS